MHHVMSSTNESTRYKLVFFAPPQSLPSIKEAVFATGAGSFPGQGDYTQVCFTTPGIGQFLPGKDAKPAIGQPGKLEELGEARCEIPCANDVITKTGCGGTQTVNMPLACLVGR